ncbi:MAG: hypothetical protein V8S99_03730 [Oscillospiraceae bacterium]
MKTSTKGRYALRLLLDIAQNQQDGFRLRSRRSPSGRRSPKSISSRSSRF